MSTTIEPSPPRVPSERPGPRGGKRDANRRRRIAQLCDAALALYLEHGLGSVTVDQIVDRAGVAKGSFYRYFDDQTQLVATLLEPLTTSFRAAMATAQTRLESAGDPDELPAIYLALAAELAAAVGPRLELMRFYLQECRAPPAGARRPVRLLANEIAERGIRLSTIAREFGLLRDSDPRVGALTVIGAVERLTFGFLSGEDVGRPEAIPATLISVILDGVGARR